MNDDMIKTICEMIALFFATFLGAYFAFMLNKIKSKSEEDAKRYAACLKAQFSFYQYYQTILNIKSQFLDASGNDPERETKIKHISFCDNFVELDISTLSFILTTKKPELLNKITNSYQNCIAAIDSVKERNDQYRRVASSAQVSSDGTITVSVIESQFLKDYTDIMYSQLPRTIELIKSIDDDLKNFIKSRFENKHALCTIPITKQSKG